MRRQLFASAAAIALFAVFDGALAQDAGGTSGTTQNPPAAADQAPAGSQQAPATSDSNLPEVKVIQQQAKPKPVKQAKKKAKAPPAPVATAPSPAGPQEPTGFDTTAEGASFAQPTVAKMSPVRGSEIPIDKIPSTVSTMTAADIASRVQ